MICYKDQKKICIIYRIWLKAMTTICPQAKIMSTKGETTLFYIDSHKSNLSFPKTLTQSEIDLSKSWKLEKIILPRVTLKKTESITECLDGDVEVTFKRNKEEENKQSP